MVQHVVYVVVRLEPGKSRIDCLSTSSNHKGVDGLVRSTSGKGLEVLFKAVDV